MSARSDALLGTSAPTSSRAAALLGSSPFEEPGGSGVFGFLGNLVGGARDLVGGLAGLGAEAIHDIGRGVAQVIPGHQTWGPLNDVDPTGYHLDQIATALPGAVWEDLRTRYGPLLRGDLGEFGEQLYEQPLSFGLDALAVGGAGAGLARAVGGAAVRGSESALAAANSSLGALLGDSAAALPSGVRAAVGTSGRSATSAAIRSGLDTLAAERALSPLESLARRTLPSPTLRRIGGEVPTLAPFAPSPNPVARAMAAPFRRLATETLEPLQAEVDDVARQIADRAAAGLPESKALEARLDRLSETLDQARAAGLERIARPQIGELNLWNTTRRTLGELNAHWLRVRTERLRAVSETLRPFYRRDKTFGERAHGTFMNLDIEVEGLDRSTWADDVLETVSTHVPRPSIFERIRQQGGVSVRLLTGEEPAAGFMVTRPSYRYGRVVQADDFFDPERGAQALEDYIEAHLDELADDDYLGIWHDVNNDEIALDVSMNVLDEGEARRLAAENDQQAIWDVANGREIPTGGTGSRDELARAADEGAPRAPGDVPPGAQGLGQAAARAAGGRTPEVEAALQTLLAPSERVARAPGLTEAERATATAAHPSLVAKVDEAAEAVRQHLDEVSDEELAAKGVERTTEADAAERYIGGLYDSVRRAVDGYADDVAEAKEAMRLVLSDEEIARLRAGDTVEHLMERRYRPLTMKYGRRVNPDTNEFEGGPSWRELDDAMAAAGISQPLYFPFIDSERMRLTDFLLNRSRIGAVKMARDPHERLMRGTLLERGTYLKDPMEAYSRRAARLTHAEETYRFIHETVRALGRPVGALDEIAPGEMVVAPEGLWRIWRSKIAFEDLVDDLTSAGAEANKTLLDALKAVLFRNQDEIVQAMGTTSRGMELYAVPRNVARQMESYGKWSGAFGGKALRLFWDKPQDVWRAFVLSGSPRWLVNNVIGNTVFLKLQGARLTDVLRIAEERFKKLLNERLGTRFDLSFLEDLNAVPGMERVGSGFSLSEGLRSTHLGSTADTATGRLYQRISGAGGKVVHGARAYGSFMTRLNSAAEEVFRQASYLKALERQQILSTVRPVARELWSTKARLDRLLSSRSEITEGKIAAALDEMNRAMGNYGALGPIERNVVRRFFVPFYGYLRHQAQLLVRLPFNSPGKAELLNHIATADAEFMEQYGPIPEWLVGAAPLGPPGPQVSFLTQRGAEPFAASFSDPVGMLSLPIKIALERAQGRSSFTGEPFTDPNIIRPYGSDQAFRIVRDAAGNPIDAVPVEGAGSMPGILEHLLSQLPQYEMAEQALAGGRTWDTATLLDSLLGRAARTDRETGEPLYPTSFGDQLGRLLGFPTYEYDLAGYQDRLEELRRSALSAAS